MVKYNISSTGSDGNATILEDFVLIDCGVPYKALEPYVTKLKLVLLTHIHSQTKAVADAAKDSAETSKAAAETSKDLLNKTTAAAQQAAASAASASYALGPDESGRLSFFIKKST